MTTDIAQRRLLEVLAAFHHSHNSSQDGEPVDALGALLAGVREAGLLNAEMPDVDAIFGAFFDLIAAVRDDLMEKENRHG